MPDHLPRQLTFPASLQASFPFPLFLRNSVHPLPAAHIWNSECCERASVLLEGNYSSSQGNYAEPSLAFGVTNLLQILQLHQVLNFGIMTLPSFIPKNLPSCKLPHARKHSQRKPGGEAEDLQSKALLSTAQLTSSSESTSGADPQLRNSPLIPAPGMVTPEQEKALPKG